MTRGLFEKVLVSASFALSVLALVVMMFATVADVIMANLFHHPITGIFDLVEVMLVLVVFLGFPTTFLSSKHIAVELVDYFVAAAMVARLKLVAKLLSALFLAFLVWQMIAPARDAFRFGERMPELGLPLYVLWIPMIFGLALSALMVLLSLWRGEQPSPGGE